MKRARQQQGLGRFAWAFVVLAAIALVLILSTATALSAGHGLDQITLALPVFFIFWVLATALGDWLNIELFPFTPKAELSAALTRGPPA